MRGVIFLEYKDKYNIWLKSELIDNDTKGELKGITDEKDIEDRFYKDLEFGTGGLRGVIGAGSNRMNIYTVGKATQGLSDFLNKKYKNPSVSIAFDSRNMSKEFAEVSALVLCGNGIKVNLFESLRPTPMLSFTVRELKSQAGIVITASHNPKIYNGYKVYGEDGGQLTDESADLVLSSIEKIEDFSLIKKMEKAEAVKSGLLNIIGENVDKIYIDKVKALTIREDLVKKNAKDLIIIYTPIHGTGNIPVRRVLRELGYENLHVVKEQEKPDGNFPTAAYPNPEDPKVFKIALEMAKDIKPDVIFGTDPDCDRIGVVVKDDNGDYQVLTGNQTGVLLSHYIMSSLKEEGKLPKNGVIVKTIVTSEMITPICKDFDIEKLDVLTGFKYIGEKIKEFEVTGEKKYLFGFEESYGYLAGEFVRDKDAVIAAELICEMALYYKSKGINLYNALMNLYKKYGFFKESLVSITLEGKEGQEKIGKAIEVLRHSKLDNINGVKIVTKYDYKLSIETDVSSNLDRSILLPKSNVLKFKLEDDSWFVVRPSGTEPKMKIYMAVKGSSLKDAEDLSSEFKNNIMAIVNNACK
jgi:phosphoglucomutase